MAGLLRGVAEGARGLFVHDSDEELDDAGVEALLVRACEAALNARSARGVSSARPRRSAWTAASQRRTGVRHWRS